MRISPPQFNTNRSISQISRFSPLCCVSGMSFLCTLRWCRERRRWHLFRVEILLVVIALCCRQRYWTGGGKGGGCRPKDQQNGSHHFSKKYGPPSHRWHSRRLRRRYGTKQLQLHLPTLHFNFWPKGVRENGVPGSFRVITDRWVTSCRFYLWRYLDSFLGTTISQLLSYTCSSWFSIRGVNSSTFPNLLV